MSDYAGLIAELDEGCNDGGDLPSLLGRARAAIEALVKERDEQGSCWDEGMTLPVREGECAPMPPKCELPHGDGGAHRAGAAEWMRRDSYNSVVAERDELRERLAAAEEGLFRVVVAIGEDTDGARTARDYFGPLTVLVRDQPPITDPVGITLHLVSEYRREMEQEADIADARVAEAERERDELAAVIDGVKNLLAEASRFREADIDTWVNVLALKNVLYARQVREGEA